MIEWIHDWVALIISSAVALAFAAIKIREKWVSSDTNSLAEKAKQAGDAVYINMLEQSRADATELRAQNKAVREMFEAALIEFRQRLDVANDRIGTLIEDVAELTGREDSCQRELAAMREQIQRNEIAAEDRNKTLRNALANRDVRIHDLMNRLKKAGGDLTGTDMVPRD